MPPHLAQPWYVALGQALIWVLYPDEVEGFVNWVPLPSLGLAVDCDRVTTYICSCLKRDSNWRPSGECLLEFDTCSKPLSHHGWFVGQWYCKFFFANVVPKEQRKTNTKIDAFVTTKRKFIGAQYDKKVFFCKIWKYATLSFNGALLKNFNISNSPNYLTADPFWQFDNKKYWKYCKIKKCHTSNFCQISCKNHPCQCSKRTKLLTRTLLSDILNFSIFPNIPPTFINFVFVKSPIFKWCLECLIIRE